MAPSAIPPESDTRPMTETAVMTAITQPTPAADLRAGDTVLCDYLPVLWFDVEQRDLSTHRAGTVKNFRARPGISSAVGITGTPVTDRPGTVLAVIPVGSDPHATPDQPEAVLALRDPVVAHLHNTLAPGHVIVLICPQGRTTVDRVVKVPDSPLVSVLTPTTAASRTHAIDLLIGSLPLRDLLDSMRTSDLSEEITDAISRALIEVVTE